MFTIYDATQYTGKPDAATIESQYGFKPITVSGTMFELISGVRYVNACALYALVKNCLANGFPLVLDFEWGNTEQLVTAISASRIYGGHALKIGAYGYAPDATGPGAQQAMKNSWGAATWLAGVKVAQPIVDMVDFVMPSCYLGDTGGGNYISWTQTVTLALCAARLAYPGKPLIPFIWPYAKNGDPLVYATHDQFWGVMQTMQSLADGCVIWSNPGEAWNQQADWLATAAKFAKGVA